MSELRVRRDLGLRPGEVGQRGLDGSLARAGAT